MPAIFSGADDKQLPIQTRFFLSETFQNQGFFGFQEGRCARIDEWCGLVGSPLVISDKKENWHGGLTTEET